MEGEAQWREKPNEGNEHDKWRTPMEDGSTMEGECSQREKCIEGGSMMEGECSQREKLVDGGHDGEVERRAPGTGDRKQGRTMATGNSKGKQTILRQAMGDSNWQQATGDRHRLWATATYNGNRQWSQAISHKGGDKDMWNKLCNFWWLPKLNWKPPSMSLALKLIT